MTGDEAIDYIDQMVNGGWSVVIVPSATDCAINANMGVRYLSANGAGLAEAVANIKDEVEGTVLITDPGAPPPAPDAPVPPQPTPGIGSTVHDIIGNTVDVTVVEEATDTSEAVVTPTEDAAPVDTTPVETPPVTP